MTDHLKGISAVRNYIAHDYDSTDDNIIEEVVRYNLPIFKQTILNIKKNFKTLGIYSFRVLFKLYLTNPLFKGKFNPTDRNLTQEEHITKLFYSNYYGIQNFKKIRFSKI